MSWVQSEAANFSLESDCRGCVVLLCLVVCTTLLASFFLPASVINMYMHTLACTRTHTIYANTYMHMHTHVHQMYTRQSSARGN